jgi:dipeptidyl aminopeptidase/acylaminoacyl peptidase
MKNVISIVVVLLAFPVFAQTDAPPPAGPPAPATARALERLDTSIDRSFEVTQKAADDLLWHLKLSDVANVDKVRIASSKPRRSTNPTAQSAGLSLILPAYVFTPKNVRANSPLIVFIHGGVHGDFDTFYAHIVRELISEGYVIVAPEYRGSTGYGGEMYNQIDYGGAEVDDVHDVRNWAVENLDVDAKRVGIIGWSHGGYQTLLNIFRWPNDYTVAYAGVPVSDLVQRMGYKSEGYRDMFAEFVGKQAEGNVAEYRRRSPVTHVDKLQTPLLIHTTTNDEDVNVLEVEHLIAALKAAGKKFEYKIYENAPGGHVFNRIDTRLARDSRREIWAFLARYLK